LSWWNEFILRRFRDSVAAISEVMFPENDAGDPDWRDTEMVERTIEYIELLPPRPTKLLKLLFVAVELAAPLLLVWPGRFSKAPYERRKKVLLNWRTSWFRPFKMLAEALKAQLCMTYMSHPDVQERMGVWKSCDRPFDSYPVPVVEDPFDPTQPNGLKAEVQ
jgi:hypothetical protein